MSELHQAPIRPREIFGQLAMYASKAWLEIAIIFQDGDRSGAYVASLAEHSVMTEKIALRTQTGPVAQHRRTNTGEELDLIPGYSREI